jgi:hypothetical protein
MTRRAAEPHERFDEWLLSGARGEPARDLALHASLCPACTARIRALDLLMAVDAGRAPRPLSLVGARRPAGALRRMGLAAVALGGVTLAAALIGVASWRLIDLQGLAEPVDENAGATPAQAVLGGTGESSQAPSPEASSAAPSSAEPAATATGGPSQAAAATVQPTSPPVNQPGATPRPSTARPSVSASSPTSVAPSPSPTSTPTGSPTPTPPGSATPDPAPTPTPQPSAGPDDCADGIDNDGDLLIDGLDPGCLLDGDEASL